MSIFPRRLVHGTGVPMELDDTRLLIATKEPIEQDDLAARLKQARVVLEDAGDEQDARQLERINHTADRFWIRSADREPLDEGRIGLLREVLGDVLAWIGPVYRLGGGQSRSIGRSALVAPLPHVVLVRFRRGVEGPVVRALTSAARGLKVTEDRERSKYLNGLRYFVIDDPAQVNAYQLRDLLLEGQREQVADVRLETMPMVVPAAVIPNDTLWAQQWDMVQIEAPAGWDISTGSASVVVCVLDEGCDLTHPDLVFAGTGINLGSMSGDGSPTGSHGTACAGIVAATFNNSAGVAGVAGSAQILPAAFVTWSDAEIAAGISWATTNGADVISMSFGGTTSTR